MAAENVEVPPGTGNGIPFPTPGSVSKKYSARLTVCAYSLIEKRQNPIQRNANDKNGAVIFMAPRPFSPFMLVVF